MSTRDNGIKNVKAFGATGNGSTNDAAAIQAAIDYRTSPYTDNKRGIIFFPNGVYNIGSTSLTFNYASGTEAITDIGFLGAPGAKIIGNNSGSMFYKAPNTFIATLCWMESLQIENSHATGTCVTVWDCVGFSARDLYLNGHRGIDCNAQSSVLETVTAIRGGPLTVAGSVGIHVGNNCQVINCDSTSFAIGLVHENVGLSVIGGRFEQNIIGILIGATIEWSATNDTYSQSTNFFLGGPSLESNGTGLLIRSGANGLVQCKTGAAASPVSGTVDYGIRMVGGNDIGFIGSGASSSIGFTQSGIRVEGGTRITFLSTSADSWSIAGPPDYQLIGCNYTPTVANLPSASAVPGRVMAVSDSTVAAPTAFGQVVVGGGAFTVGVMASNSTWKMI